jgi:hypothetical protein
MVTTAGTAAAGSASNPELTAAFPFGLVILMAMTDLPDLGQASTTDDCGKSCRCSSGPAPGHQGSRV